MDAQNRLHGRSDGIDDEAREKAGEQAEHGQDQHGRKREAVGFLRLGGGLRPRAAKKCRAERRTKQVAASATASASTAPAAGASSFKPHCGSAGLKRTAWKVSHSDAKALNGGSAEMPMHPPSTASAVTGMRWMRPPSLSMSRAPVAVNTAPAPKNRRLLSIEWLNT